MTNKSNNSFIRESILESYFGQINYDYKGKYFLLASVRSDGSSKFVNNKWGTFGALGLLWVASKESFIENIDLIKFLKVKSSYGLVGNQALAIDGASNFYPGNDCYDIDNLDDKPSFSFNDKGNPDLTWEISKMFQNGNRINTE